MSEAPQVTVLLQRFRAGDKEAAAELMPLVYKELRRLAASRMKGEKANHTLQPTALVHEVYLKLAGGSPVDWRNRSHFFAVAAQQMRRIIVDHARATHAEKRGGGAVAIALDDVGAVTAPLNESMLALDEALRRLEKVDARAARVVELRYFGGLKESETAEALGVGVSTMKRDWEFARAWLASQLKPAPVSETGQA